MRFFILYNFCSWLMAQLAPGAPVWFIIRLPSLLAATAGTAGTALGYALLTHFRNFRRAQPPGPVFLSAMYHEVMFFHYALLDGRPLTLDVQRAPGVRYPYWVWAKGQAAPPPAWLAALPYRVAYEDATTIIYTLAASPAGSR